MEKSPEEVERLTIMDSIATVGDNKSSTEAQQHIKELRAELLAKLKTNRDPTLDAIIIGLKHSSLGLPIKAPHFATLTGLLTADNVSHGKEMAGRLVDVMVRDLVATLRDGKSGRARRSLRFLASLSETGVVIPDGLANYIVQMLEVALVEMTTAKRSDRGVHCRGPFLAEIALSAIPWAGSAMKKAVPDRLDHIMSIVHDIRKAWKPGQWRCVLAATHHRSLDCFSDLLNAIIHLSTLGWVCPGDIIATPHEYFQEELSKGVNISMPPLVIPGHSKLSRYSSPRFRLILVNENPSKVEDVDMEDVASSDQKLDGKKNEKIDSQGGNDGNNGTTPESSTIVPTPMISDLEQVEKEEMRKTSLENEKAGKHSVENVEKEASADNADMSKIDHEENVMSDGDGKTSVGADGRQTPTDVKVISVNGENVNNMDTENADVSDKRSAENQELNTEKISPSTRSVVENFVLRSYVNDIIDNFSDNHMMAAQRLLNMPMFTHVNDEIVEGVFSHMCAMPMPTYPPIYYGTLFVDLCRVKDSRLPAKLLTAVETMFQEARQFDPEAFDRLTDWFSFHLSNFGYKWNWSDWGLYADVDMVDKFPYRALFCKDVLARCIRLSYYERIMKMIPVEMKCFLPPVPSTGNKARFDENNDELMKMVTGKDRQPSEVVKEKLISLFPVVCPDGDPDKRVKAEMTANLTRLAALIRSILQAGCKTLSHFDIVSERFEKLLREMSVAGGHRARQLVTLEVTTFWSDVHIRRMYVLDKLRARGVIDGGAIIDACLAYERMDEWGTLVSIPESEIATYLSESSCWEMIRLVMSRACSREEAARSELQWASQAAAAANEGETENAELNLEQAKTNTEKAKFEVSELVLVALRRLFGICARLLTVFEIEMDVEEMASNGDNMKLPGFGGKPIWYWRCVGMIRELARKHPRHLPIIMDQLDTDTKDNREEHRVLWESFEIIKEAEGCAILSQVW